MKTEPYIVKRDTPCLKNNKHSEMFNSLMNIPSHGWVIWQLFNGCDYDITNLKLIEDDPINDTFYDVQTKIRVSEEEVNWSHYYSFELWDEHGHIGDYMVEQLSFEENCELILNEERPTHKEYWDRFESASKKYNLCSPEDFEKVKLINEPKITTIFHPIYEELNES